MFPYSSYALQSTLASLLVYFKPSGKQNNDKEIIGAKTKGDSKFQTLSKNMERSKKDKFIGEMITDIE